MNKYQEELFNEELQIYDNFKDHMYKYDRIHLSSGEILEFIRWGSKFRSSIYLVDFFFKNGILMVSGDIGDAVYVWHNSIGSLRNVSNVSIDYFASKCVASPVGIGYKSWSSSKALDILLETTDNETIKRFERNDGLEAILSRNGWEYWLSEHGMDVFGYEYFELIGIGDRPSIECRYHLIGLQMSYKQLEKMEKNNEKW